MIDQAPSIVRTTAALRAQVLQFRQAGKTIGLVPTMGALHHGHLSLIEAITAHVDVPIVSIFVNPTQFGEGEDFASYPRDEKTDLGKLSTTKTSLVFIPTVEEMYPDGDASKVLVKGITDKFEGAARPGHFDGVATVVSKLLQQCQPDVAIFGEKDFQQLAVIRRFVRDLHMPVKVIGGPIVREHDGLAASSRNVYLTEKGRKTAGQLNLVLKQLVKSVQAGKDISEAEASATNALLGAGFSSVDYVSVVDPATLEPIAKFTQIARVLAVARIDGVRLLDNMAIEAP